MPFLLEILRHGEAFDHSSGGDAQRPLTPVGQAAVRSLATRLAREAWQPDRVFSSPYLRAAETARLVVAVAPRAVEIETLEELTPDRDPDELTERLSAQGVEAGRILVVGHQPLLGRLIAHLVGSQHGLAVGEMVRVDCPPALHPGTGKIVARL